MEGSTTNDNGVKFLVPNVIQRSRKLAKMGKHLKRIAPHVKDVYNSKKKCLVNLKAQYKQLSELVAATKQKRNALLLKRNDDYVKFVGIIEKAKQLQSNKQKMLKEKEAMIDKFGEALDEIDGKFLNAFKNSTRDTIGNQISDLNNQIAKELGTIEKLKKMNHEVYVDDTVPNLRTFLSIYGPKIKEDYDRQREEYNKLCLEVASDYNT